jgi:hypothetical protein
MWTWLGRYPGPVRHGSGKADLDSLPPRAEESVVIAVPEDDHEVGVSDRSDGFENRIPTFRRRVRDEGLFQDVFVTGDRPPEDHTGSEVQQFDVEDGWCAGAGKLSQTGREDRSVAQDPDVVMDSAVGIATLGVGPGSPWPSGRRSGAGPKRE